MAAAAKPAPAKKSVAQAILDNLTSVFHLTSDQAAGFLGNFKIESGFDPNAYNPHENAHGIAQWENGRWSGPHGLQAFAAAHHLAPTSIDAELGYLDYELTHGFANVLTEVRSTNSATDAAHYVQRDFEISAPETLGARQSAAAAILDQIHGGGPIGGGPLTTGGAAFLNSSGGPQYGGANQPPYDPNKLTGALTKAQRKAIETFVVFYSIVVNATGSGPRYTAAQVKKLSDDELKKVYAALNVIWQGNNKPATGPSADAAGIVAGVESWAQGIFTKLGAWVGDAFLIVIGVLMAIVALWIVARSSGTDVSIAGGDDEHQGAGHDAAAAGAAAE